MLTERTVRAFIAIDLPEEVTRALSQVTRRLREAGIDGLRPVRPEGIHLTLKFLGDIEESRLVEVAPAVRGAAALHDGFEIRTGAAGVFPSARRPRILWVGIEGCVNRLLRLQEEMEAALGRLGFPRESRPYSPHLTVARIGDRTPGRDSRRAVEALGDGGAIQGKRIPVRSVSLIESVIGRRGGSTYVHRGRSDLAEGRR